jgi:hypothetical protein
VKRILAGRAFHPWARPEADPPLAEIDLCLEGRRPYPIGCLLPWAGPALDLHVPVPTGFQSRPARMLEEEDGYDSEFVVR